MQKDKLGHVLYMYLIPYPVILCVEKYQEFKTV